FHFYKQLDQMDCGPTCLRMVAMQYGRSIPLQEIREKAQIGKEGVNLLGISEAAESIGFRTQSLRITYDSLVRDAKLPAILYWDQNHFVVLYKAKKHKLFIADPAKGLITYSPQEFKNKWISDKSETGEEGISLLLEPTPVFYERGNDPEEKEKAGLHLRNIFSYVRPYKKLVAQLFIGLGVASLLQLFLAFLTQSIVDTGVNTGNLHFVYIVLLAQLALFAGRLAVEFVRGWILLHIS